MSHTPSFLHLQEPTKLHKRNRRRRFFRQLLRVFLVVFVGWIFLLLLNIGQLIAAGLNLREALQNASEHTNTLAFEQAEQDMAQANRALFELEKSFYFLTQIWIFPGLKNEFEQMIGFFNASHQVTESFASLLHLATDVRQLAGINEEMLLNVSKDFSPEVTFKDLPSATKRAILERLRSASSDLHLFSTRIHLVLEEADSLQHHRLMAPFFGSLDPSLRRLEAIDERLKTTALFAQILPEFFGLKTDRTHLLLFLNNDELRPGGGFIGTYGLMRVRDGEVVSLAIKDSYAIDRLVESVVTAQPPLALAKYNATSRFFFRDGNWSPDFAVSAQQLITLFEKESVLTSNHADVPTATRIDSVIGFTPELASSLLEFLGPVEVSGQTFTSKNVPDLIEYEVERGFQQKGIVYENRKEILSSLVAKIQERLVVLPFSKWSELFTLISQTGKSKHLAVFSTNGDVQDVLSRAGFAGSVRPQTPDSQLFVDANLASLKSDPFVKRSLTYEIFRNESGTWIGRTTMTYHHEGSFDWRTTRYRTFARLYLPKGSELIRVVGLTDGPSMTEDLDMTVIEGFAVIEPGETHSLIYEYRLSTTVVEAIAKQQYGLTFFKQMGARDYALTLDLDFDKNVTQAMPAENKNEWGDDHYRLNTKLSQDIQFEIGL